MPPEAKPASPGASWRDSLGPLLGEPPAGRGEAGATATNAAPVGATHDAAPGAEPVALALQWELRELTPRTTYRWNGPTSRPARGPGGANENPGEDPEDASAPTSAPTPIPAAAASERPEYRLGVRPVARTATGWARGGLSWSNIAHRRVQQNLHPEQHRWFCQFGALHRAGIPPAPGQDVDWVFLDEFSNPVLWALLDQADTLGIPMLGMGRGTEVARGVGARLSLDAVRRGTGISLRPRAEIDGTEYPPAEVRPIGDHGLYRFQLGRPHRYLIAPTGRPLDAAQLALLRAAPSRVPAAQSEEFLREVLPELSARVEVDSSDRSVPLPEPRPAELVLEARFGPRKTLALAWHWSERALSEPPRLSTVLPEGLLPAELLPAEYAPAAPLDAGPLPTAPLDAVQDPAGARPADAAGRDRPEPSGQLPRAATLRGAAAAAFAEHALPALRALPGVRVSVSGEAPAYRELEGEAELTVTAVPSSDNDWLELGVILTVGGRAIPFGPLFRALAKGSKRLLLVDNTYFSLSHPALEPLLALIQEARDLNEWEPGSLRIPRHAVSLWSDFEDLADRSEATLEWRALVGELVRDAEAAQAEHALGDGGAPAGSTPGPLLAARPVPPPAGLAARMRPYQLEGYSWLSMLYDRGLGAILADDMGLGKTLQCLALIQRAVEARPADRPHRPVLVVAPTSVVSNWAAESARFTPGLRVRTITATEGGGGHSIAALAEEADILVTSYALLRLDFEAYQGVARGRGWDALILDEAQFIKNAASRANECARELEVRFKLAVTGTPLENSLTELHALFRVVAPGLFPSARRFAEEYVRPIEAVAPGITSGVGAGSAARTTAQGRAQRLERLRRRARPFLLRRTKSQVAPELPPIQQQVIAVTLSPEHRELYDVSLQRERQKLFGLLEDLDRTRFIVFRSLTLLRLLSLDAALIGEEYEGIASAKLDVLLERLGAAAAEGHRSLVFSQFTSFLARAAARLDRAGIAYCVLDGSTRDREAVIRAFREGEAPVFLISLKAGGFGLNLTEADNVFLLDPWWNPASEQQAIDRTHRIGQTRSVMVYRLIASDTIEERVMALKARKAELFTAVLDGGEGMNGALGAEEIRELLA